MASMSGETIDFTMGTLSNCMRENIPAVETDKCAGAV